MSCIIHSKKILMDVLTNIFRDLSRVQSHVLTVYTDLSHDPSLSSMSEDIPAFMPFKGTGFI